MSTVIKDMVVEKAFRDIVRIGWESFSLVRSRVLCLGVLDPGLSLSFCYSSVVEPLRSSLSFC